MAKRDKRHGDIGPIRASTGPKGPSVNWDKIALPDGKSDIEDLYARQFVAAFNRDLPLPGLVITGVRQNPENSLDFTIATSAGDNWLELTEIAPFEFFGVPPDQAPNEHSPYDLGQFLHKKIMEKSRKYRSARPGNLFLLLYLTDWRFLPGQTTIALLQYWCSKITHSFQAIFFYMPLTAHQGHLTLIAPTPSKFWKRFDPEMHRNNKMTNLDPSKWKIVRGQESSLDQC